MPYMYPASCRCAREWSLPSAVVPDAIERDIASPGVNDDNPDVEAQVLGSMPHAASGGLELALLVRWARHGMRIRQDEMRGVSS